MSSLETSVTLDDVFTVVEAKRVPLAPELAGYLSLEIADGADPGGGEVEPRTVFISEEGTVALVRPKDKPGAGDAEASVRAILTKLLDASGSSTPALSAAAKRRPISGLPALVEELEAALIPVNRSAGRRALARLAREVKRVTMGVGRNASVPPPGRAPAATTKKEDEPPASLDVSTRGRMGSFSDEALTAKRPQLAQLPDVADAPVPAPRPMPEPEPVAPPAPLPRAPLPPPPQRSGGSGPVPVVSPPQRSGVVAVAPPPPPQRPAALERAIEQAIEKALEPAPEPVKLEPPPPKRLFGGDEVDSLLASFEVEGGGEKEMSRDLKAIAGLDPTPPPPDAKTLAELTKDVGKDLPKIAKAEGDGVEALLALSEASGPLLAIPTPPPIPLPPPLAVSVPSANASHSGGGAPPPSAPISLAPPSPLVPSSMLGAPQPVSAVDPPPVSGPALPPAGAARGPSGASASSRREKLPEPPPARRPKDRGPREPRAPKTGLAMLVIALIVLLAGAGAIYKMNPAFFLGRKRAVPTPTTEPTAPSAIPAVASKCKVALVVTDVPANAEVLLRVGQATLDVERMPVGTRLEFVGTAEGFAPRRAIIKPEAVWDKTPDGKPRIDLPIQLDPSKAKPGQIDPWPAADPGSQVGGSGMPGTVHVVSNPRGAEVWLLAGLGPEARIEQLKCEGDIDVLLAGPPTVRKRLHVPEKDIAAAPDSTPGNKVVTISAK